MYFDPGTGSLIIQVLVAAIASIGAFFAIFKKEKVLPSSSIQLAIIPDSLKEHLHRGFLCSNLL